MIYQNDEIYNIPKDGKVYLNGEEINLNKLREKPLEVRLVPEQGGARKLANVTFKKNPNRKVAASTYTLPAKYVGENRIGKDTGGRTDEAEWRYVENVSGPKDDRKYNPLNIEFTDGKILTSDISLAWFLLNHPKIQGNAEHYDNPVFFYRHNPVGVSKSNVKAQEKVLEAQNLILGNKKLPKEKLVDIAYGVGIAGADNMYLETLQERLYEMATNNPTLILDTATSKNVKVKSLINRAEQAAKIRFNDKRSHWEWVGEDNDTGFICTVPKGMDKVVFFAKWLTDEDDTQVLENLQFAMMTKKEKEAQNKANEINVATPATD